MSMGQDMGLHVDITGESGSLVSATEQATGAISGFEGVSTEAIASLTKAVEKLDLDFTALTPNIQKTTVATSELATIGGDAARAMNAVGASGAGAASRVAALTGALNSLKAAAVPMVATLGAFAIAMSGFEFLKDGIANAEALQHSLETLRATVENSGGSWDSVSASVHKFLDAESMASGIARTELAEALNQATAATGNLSDATKIVAISEEVGVTVTD